MSWHMTAKKLKAELSKYDDNAIIMIGSLNEDGDQDEAFEASDDVSYMYVNDEGEIFSELEADDSDVLAKAKRAIVLWPIQQ